MQEKVDGAFHLKKQFGTNQSPHGDGTNIMGTKQKMKALKQRFLVLIETISMFLSQKEKFVEITSTPFWPKQRPREVVYKRPSCLMQMVL